MSGNQHVSGHEQLLARDRERKHDFGLTYIKKR